MMGHYEFTVDGGEPLAVHEEAGVFHMHMYPFVVFASVEDAALEWVKQIYGGERGRSVEPEHAHGRGEAALHERRQEDEGGRRGGVQLRQGTSRSMPPRS